MDEPKRWVEVELGDNEVTVDEFPDGMFVVRMKDSAEPLLLNPEQMQAVTKGFAALKKEKAWR